jgi:hypothetical protein
MNQEEYVKNLLDATKAINKDILNNSSFEVEDLESIDKKMADLISQLSFWSEQNNSTRFIYELKSYLDWVLKNYA